MAQNVLSGMTKIVTSKNVDTLHPEKQILVDVRTREEYNQGHIELAQHIPVDELRSRLHELDPEKEIYVYCAVGFRGYIASRILQQNGYKVKNLTGGYRSYLMAK